MGPPSRGKELFPSTAVSGRAEGGGRFPLMEAMLQPGRETDGSCSFYLATNWASELNRLVPADP